MAFSLRNFLEEAYAEVNPFDGGKTATTIRANRNIPPAQTQRRYAPGSSVRGTAAHRLDQIQASKIPQGLSRGSRLAEMAAITSRDTPLTPVSTPTLNNLRNATRETFSQRNPVVKGMQSVPRGIEEASRTLLRTGSQLAPIKPNRMPTFDAPAPTGLHRALVGGESSFTGEPGIKTFQSQGETLNKSLTGAGYPGLGKAAEDYAPVVGFGLVASDFVTGGGGSQLTKQLAKQGTKQAVKQTTKKAGLNLTDDALELIARTKNKGEIDNILRSELKPKPTTKLVPQATSPQVGKTGKGVGETPLYRGMTSSEWNDIQNGGVSANKKTGKAFVGAKSDAEMTVEAHSRSGKKGNVVVEYKPTARGKLVSGENLGTNTGGNLPGEYQAKGLGLSDISKVTDENGKVIYRDSAQPKSPPITPFEQDLQRAGIKPTQARVPSQTRRTPSVQPQSSQIAPQPVDRAGSKGTSPTQRGAGTGEPIPGQKLLPSPETIQLTPAQAKQRFKSLNKQGRPFEISNPQKDVGYFTVSPNGTVKKGKDAFNIKIKQRGTEKSIVVDPNKPLLDIDPNNIGPVKDITNYAKGLKDFFRNTERVFGSMGEKPLKEVKEQVLNPFDDSKGKFIDTQNQLLDELDTTIVKGLGIKPKSKMSAAVQTFGEGLKGEKEVAGLVGKFGRDKAVKIIEADRFFRSKYDSLLDEINKARAKTYPGQPDKLIPKRGNYYRHFTELQEGLGAIKNIFDTPANIDPSLAGVSDFTQPKSKWLSIAQKRLGNKTEVDAVSGYLNYVRQASYAQNIDPHIKRIHDLRDQLVDLFPEGDVRRGSLNNYIEYLSDFANELAGKTNPADRVVQKFIPGGRTTFRAMDWMNRRVKANVILGNASSSLAQVFNLPQGISDAGVGNASKGLPNAIRSILGHSSPADNSTFLKERYFKGYDKFDSGILTKPKKFAAWMITVGDEIGTKIIHSAEYQKALKTMSPADAIKFADNQTRKMVAGRGIGEVPLMQKSRFAQMIAPFQLEVQNMWHVQGDFVGNKEFGKLAKMTALMFLMNRGAEKIRGSDVAFDPIQATIEAFDAYAEEEDKKIGALRAGGRLGGEVLSNVIGGQTVASIYPEYGMEVRKDDPDTPESEREVVTRKELFGKGDPTRFGGGALLTKGISDPLYKLAPPFGGQQVKRTLESKGVFDKGVSESKSGAIRFPVEDDFMNQLQGLIFGQYATKEGRKYTSEDLGVLGKDQSEMIRDLPKDKRQQYYDAVIGLRDSDKPATGRNVAKELGNQTGDYNYYDQGYGLSTSKKPALSNAKQMLKGSGFEGIPDKAVDEYLKRNNLKREDVQYAVDADQNTDEKLKYIDKNIKDREQLLSYLKDGRKKSLSGDYRANDKLLRTLYDNGVLSNKEYYGLKNIKDGVYGTSSKSGKKSGGKGRKGGKKGKYDYKMFGLISDPLTTSKSLRQLLKEAKL